MSTNNQGPKTKDWCFTSFKDTLAEPILDGVQYFIAQKERCPDTGRTHWQGFVQFKLRSYRTRVQRLIADNAAHCEVRRGSPSKAAEYCKKDDSRVDDTPRIEFGQLLEPRDESVTREPGIEDVCRAALAANSREEAIEIIKQRAPSLLFRSFFGVQALLKQEFPERPVPFVYKPRFGWNLPQAITNWLSVEFPKPERAKCLIVVGASRLGKTNWARSLGPHMFWRSQVNYGDWNPDARYIVIDDIDWRFIPQKKGILTQMGEITLTDKYVKKLKVINNKPAIVLTNNEPEFETDSEYWLGTPNCVLVRITEPLFDLTQLAI